MDENIVDTTDRISQLPDFIVHHIMSFLDSYGDLVKTSVLSKKWFDLWASFPLLDFDLVKIATALAEITHKKTGEPMEALVNKPGSLSPNNEKLIKYVAYKLSRFSEHAVSAHTFKLMVHGQPAIYSLIDEWISLVVEKDVRVLDVFVRGINKYCLPNTILAARSLTRLKLDNCELPSALFTDVVKFRCLKLLSLSGVQIDDQAIKHLTTVCSRIEELSFHKCGGYENFCAFGLLNLRKVHLGLPREYEHLNTIHIEAPNLVCFCLSNKQGKSMPHINLALCKKLKALILGLPTLATAWFCKFISGFPLLEYVYLNAQNWERKFKVSSHSLRKLNLHGCSNVEEIEVDSPNLLLFRYFGSVEYSLFSLTSISAKWEACFWEKVDTLWFYKLRKFLEKANRFKVLELHLRSDMSFLDVEGLMMLQIPPYELEHLELSILVLPAFVDLVDAVFWCCHPQSLSVDLSSELLNYGGRNDLLKHVYEKFLHQENQAHEEIQIMTGRCGVQKVFVNLNSMLEALPGLLAGNKVIFKRKDVEELMMLDIPPYKLEHMELSIILLPGFVDLVDAVFWCCHPRSLSLDLNSELLNYGGRNDLLKHVYEKFLHQENQACEEIQIMT